jgi:hypothetical protein
MDEVTSTHFKLRWVNTWCKQHSKKIVGFIWSIWNKVVVVNVWKVKTNMGINKACPLCGYEKEFILHKFFNFILDVPCNLILS